jgi:hypothetical protein
MNIKSPFPDVAALAVVLIVVFLFSSYYQPQNNNLLAQTNNNAIIGSNEPLYMEHFKIIRHKEVSFNGTKVTEAMFSGNGTAKGISVTSTGNGLIIPRSAGVIYVKGRAAFIAAASADDRQTGKATYTFEAIGNYGAALFDANATGNLSFLSNTVGIYKVDMNKNGINTFTMWKCGNN